MSTLNIVFVFVGLGLFGIFPLLCVMLAKYLGKRWGCTVHAAGSGPCIVNGKDREPLLYRLFMMGMLLIFTVPLAIIGMVGFAVYLLG